MATYDNLPVYKAGYDMLVEIFRFTQNFSREYKYTLGERLKNETIDMITNIFRANTAQQKPPAAARVPSCGLFIHS
jgi:hypothetical protein